MAILWNTVGPPRWRLDHKLGSTAIEPSAGISCVLTQDEGGHLRCLLDQIRNSEDTKPFPLQWKNKALSIDRARGCIDTDLFPTAETISDLVHVASLLMTWDSGGIAIHAAGLAARDDDFGVLALAQSGGGKSTLTDLAESFESLSDETVIALPDTPPVLRGTRFKSSANKPPVLRSVRLRAILILEKRPSPSLERVDRLTAVRHIMRQAFRLPLKELEPPDLFQRACALAQSIPAFVFGFPKDHRASEALDRLHNELGE